MTERNEWFCCINGIWIHGMACDNKFPQGICKKDMEKMKESVLSLPSCYDVKEINVSPHEDFPHDVCREMASRGFVSCVQMENDKKYIVRAYPRNAYHLPALSLFYLKNYTMNIPLGSSLGDLRFSLEGLHRVF